MIIPAEQADVCVAFALGEPRGCAMLGGTRNRNYRLTTSRGDFVVRDRYAGYRDAARITFDHAAIAFLHDRGVPVAPPLPSKDGQTFWRHDPHLWEVFPAIKGRHFADGSAADVQALAAALAAFHRAGNGFDPVRAVQKLGPRGETDPSELLATLRDLPPDCRPAADRYRGWIDAAAAELSDEHFAALPHALIHGDIQPANVLIDNGRVAALIDLDWCARRPRVYDLAFAILLCCATHASPIDGGDIWSLTQPPVVDGRLVKSFLQTYNEQGWPLTSEEWTALQPQIVLSWCHCRVAGSTKVEPARKREFLERPPIDRAALLPETLGQ